MRFLNEDLYVGLCAGRDILAGRMGLPDTWSFTSDGIVWVNQGWLSHLTLYLSYLGLGEFGPVLLKIGLLIVCLCALALRSHWQGAGWEATLAALCLGTAAVAPFLQIRAENFGAALFALLGASLANNDERGPLARVVACVIMILWVNMHGSFVLGFVMIGLRILISGLLGLARGNHAPETPLLRRMLSGDTLPWIAVLALGLVAAAFLNPFGTANLFMPQRQLTADSVTALSADWAPLLVAEELRDAVWFNPMDVRPFIVVLACGLLLSGVSAYRFFSARRDGPPGIPRVGPEHAGLIFEMILPLLVIPLTFKFRRLILFGGLSLVPVLGFMLQRVLFEGLSRRLARRTSLYAGVALFLVGVWVFVFTTLPPYLPGNPCRPDKPLVSQLMSFDAPSGDLVRFMKRNRLDGRCFTGWPLSDYFLFHVPGIKVFMDCRDQSVYSDAVIREFFSVLHPDTRNPESVIAADRALRKWGVNRVILTGNPREYDLSRRLQETRLWGCVYADSALTLLAPLDDERFGADLREGRAPDLWFPDERSRDLTRAYASWFMTGRIPETLRDALMRAVLVYPDPNVYGLLTLTGLDASGGITAETRSRLTEEMKRLAQLGPTAPGVGRNVTESLIRILQLLGAGTQGRTDATTAVNHAELINDLTKRLRKLERDYLGYRFR